jgi:hypothetical protein
MGGRDGQYGSNDTGLSEPEMLFEPLQPLPSDDNNKGDIYIKTLEMIIESCI